MKNNNNWSYKVKLISKCDGKLSSELIFYFYDYTTAKIKFDDLKNDVWTSGFITSKLYLIDKKGIVERA